MYSVKKWSQHKQLSARRAIMYRPYRLWWTVSLAYKFQIYVCDYIEHVTDEFREIYDIVTPQELHILVLKVAILNAWGRLRTGKHMVAHELHTNKFILTLELWKP